MFRLLDNNDELWEQYGESSIVQRRWYYSQLRMDIDNLRKQILVLQADILVRDCGYLAVRLPTIF
jgi:hypothetical protein